MEHAFGNVEAIVGINASRTQNRDERWGSRFNEFSKQIHGE